MEIKGKVYCFFEQSGTFKDEFIKLGINAEDYDIQNNFNKTNHVVDLFKEIDNAYDGKPSIFDKITSDDLILAFYPCIYFCATSQMNMYITSKNNRNYPTEKKYKSILSRSNLRTEYLNRLIKFADGCELRSLRMIFENPWSEQTYLKYSFIKAPSIIDMNRMERGDYFKKPTAYWFWNCDPTHGDTYQNDKTQKIINKLAPNGTPGLCNEERSMISSDYARNWICDFVLGKVQQIGQLSLFE